MRQKPRTSIFGIARNRRISKRYIPDGKIEAAVGKARRFKALRGNRNIRMRRSRDACGKRIHLHPADIALRPHIFRHRREKTPCST